MDRLDALTVFISVADEGSFVAAARRLRRSPTAVTRAVAVLEDRLGTRLLTRTTRAMALTEAGQRYLDQGRRALAEFAELENSAATDRAEPTGLLTLTAPEMFGRMHVLPVAQDFMRDYPKIDVSLLLLNRVVSFVDEGVDLGVRIAHLPDSSLHATQLGSVRRIVCASPEYLAVQGEPAHPEALRGHRTITVTGVRPMPDRWSFGAAETEISVLVKPRLAVSTVQAALDAAVAGGGLVRAMSYQAAPLEAAGLLRRVLPDYEPPPIPIQLVYPAGRHLPLKTRLFIDRAIGALRGRFG
ncbi:MAG TPA: LysR substrate-binding domain-containing protein [Stellaceae bacterium]|nr:LysR substrate-binding domain-containing protein [Stellaceae bacterium]